MIRPHNPCLWLEKLQKGQREALRFYLGLVKAISCRLTPEGSKNAIALKHGRGRFSSSLSGHVDRQGNAHNIRRNWLFKLQEDIYGEDIYGGSHITSHGGRDKADEYEEQYVSHCALEQVCWMEIILVLVWWFSICALHNTRQMNMDANLFLITLQSSAEVQDLKRQILERTAQVARLEVHFWFSKAEFISVVSLCQQVY